MGGRGSSSGIALSPAQERKLEDTAQFNDAKRYGWARGARYVEYTDSNGKVKKAETGRGSGGTYRTSYNEDVANYAKMSTKTLNAELSKQRAAANDNYQRFAYGAASRIASNVTKFSEAGTKAKMIEQVLRRRRKK
jgi:hypothetical protein